MCAYARVCAKAKVTVRQIDGPQLGDKVIMRGVKCEKGSHGRRNMFL